MRTTFKTFLVLVILAAGAAVSVYGADKAAAKKMADTPEKENRKLTVEKVYEILGNPVEVIGAKGEPGNYWDEVWRGDDWYLIIQFNPKNKIEHVYWHDGSYVTKEEKAQTESEAVAKRKAEEETLIETLDAINPKRKGNTNYPTYVACDSFAVKQGYKECWDSFKEQLTAQNITPLFEDYDHGVLVWPAPKKDPNYPDMVVVYYISWALVRTNINIRWYDCWGEIIKTDIYAYITTGTWRFL